MIINLRGTHGSGKSTAVRRVMGACKSVRKAIGSLEGIAKPTVGYICELRNGKELYVVGNYANACGGADGIQPYSSIWPIVNAAAHWHDHVLFEGALVSTTYGSIGEAASAFHEDFVFAFLDTPLEECVKRVNQRRKAAGKGPLEDTANVSAKWTTIRRLYGKMTDGTIVTRNRKVLIDHQKPATELLKLLGVRVTKEPTNEAA